jgi:uncharacterized protein
MVDQNVPSTDVTSDDKLWALLAYLFTPLIPIVILLMEDKKTRPFIKAHNMQALIGGVIMYLITAVTFGCGGILWFAFLYWGIKAYQGNLVEIPLITKWCKNQGWA